MLPEARSVTKSSTLSTNKPSGVPEETPIQFVKGVGPRLGAVFKSRGIESVKDLLYFFPRTYEDRTKVSEVKNLVEGEGATVSVKILSARRIPIRKLGRSILEVRAADESGGLSFKWFHAPKAMENRFLPGKSIIATGTTKFYMGHPEMVHPEITWDTSGDENQPNVGRVIPVYVEIEGIPTRLLRKILWEAVQKYSSGLKEDLPEGVRKTHKLPTLNSAIQEIHFPEPTSKESLLNSTDQTNFNTPAHWRLIYEEFFKFEYLVLKQRIRMEKEMAPAFGKSGGPIAMRELEKLLPFQLTGDQKKAIQDILSDISEHTGLCHPMNRLIQGDVGSGKTAVAFLTAGFVLAEGAQAALMAPTEILAEQHYKNAVKLFGGRLAVALLTGKTTASERSKIQSRLKGGEPLLMIGTHALLEEPIVFKNLSLVMIDEQHRFGVEQRRTLKEKGTRVDPATGKNIYPHMLILSATPIPRTLALTAYGDLSVTSIKEMPAGRSPIVSKVVKDQPGRMRAYENIRKEIKAGHQAYFIFPLVNESEAEGFTHLKSAINEAERMAKEVFPEFKVGLLHGQMKSDEKAQVMSKFQSRELDILVSTTVVEVGVDVPNATVMAIEHSERFGLSQLHQLRGRVGRGASQSYCYFFASARPGEMTALRLEVLEETTDGFKIAEADLEIRGPGEFLGTRQAGVLPFHIANLVRDRDWLLKAREDALVLLKQDPELSLPENLSLRRYYEREGKVQFERLKTS